MASPTPELCRPFALATLSARTQSVTITTAPAERAALAMRFALPQIDALAADLDVRRTAAGLRVTGRWHARWAYECRVTGKPFPVAGEEPIDVLYSDDAGASADEAETGPERIALTGDTVDLGELVAQQFGACLEPYPRAPDADAALSVLGIQSEEAAAAERSPFAALKGATRP
jgi:uncharacterized metal-binding protein YceD (DUF177 family)